MSDIVERPDEACPMCEGKPMEPGQFCIAGCRDGMVRWASANVLRNVRPFYDADQRKIGEQAAEITRLRDEVERLREAGIALALDAGNLCVALDGQEKYRELRQAVLRSMIGFQAALPMPRAALDG